jgi:hypothetical protein
VLRCLEDERVVGVDDHLGPHAHPIGRVHRFGVHRGQSRIEPAQRRLADTSRRVGQPVEQLARTTGRSEQ